jgi:probable F420-dependent oxidoreductase
VEFALVVGGGQVRHDRHGLEVIVEEAQLAESLGYDVVFVPDHYVHEQLGVFLKDQPVYEMFFVLATLAQHTKRIKLGSHVACTLFRHPAMLARLFSQLDEASGGRVIAGVGAGWTKAEFDMLGIEFPPISERLAMMDEAVAVVRGLWGEEPLSFEGKYYTLTDAMIRPRPLQDPGPPLMIGGSGNGILRRAGQWADIIHMVPQTGAAGTTTIENVARFTDATVTEKLNRVRDESEKAGRGRDAVTYATTIFNYLPTPSPAATKKRAEGMAGVFGLTAEEYLHHPSVLAGTPEEMRDELRRRHELHGLDLVAVAFASAEQVSGFADGVMPGLS